jgi:hypothetical protein
MRFCTLSLIAIALTGCPGSDGGVGDECGGHGDCDNVLQCSSGVCVPRCARAPECGDGYACDPDGICQLASGQPGDSCRSEVECAPGLACRIDNDTVKDGYLVASCTAQQDGKPAGGECDTDDDCRNGTCALGQCVDLCTSTRDCTGGSACMEVPRVEASGSLFTGCLPSQGNIVWTIKSSAPTSSFLLPVPSAARFASLIFRVDDPQQRVGAQRLISPEGQSLYVAPCDVLTTPSCDPLSDFYSNLVRHQPEFGQSVIAFPSTPAIPLEAGAYRVQASSFRRNGQTGSAVPHITAVVRIDAATLLDLRFHFLDLDAHVCQSEMGGATFDAAGAQTAPFFQEDFVAELRGIFAHGGISLGNLSYDDIRGRPDLDELDVSDAGSLLALGSGSTGVDVFFVRALSPVGLQAFGPSPGPSGVSKTRQSGIVIGLDTLCYRSWSELARLTAHEIARYMGLPRNVELDSTGKAWLDMIDDNDANPSNNLMFYSEVGGVDITPGQRDILSRSGVLR